MILLPGFMCDADLWTDLVPLLRPGWRVLHADLFSDSSIEAMAARVLEEAPERFVAVGFSMGGFVARQIALTAPERVEALALIATSALGTTPERAERNRQRRARIAAAPFRGLSRSDLRRALHPSRRDDAVLVERMLAMGTRLGKQVLLRQLAAERVDGYGRLPEIRCPTLVVAAEADELRPRDETDRLAAGIPGARYEIVAGCGHMIPLEQPGVLAALLNGWLDQAAPATG
ncbi:alpha/beta fold hydrolase [Thalassobaculum fulvum]|uniref:alpha/beta fold hydrolase n=1 Tax=Thalassobaculum fulvum TaxID=1633335 RepID=UPI001E65D7DC|nr:alpha/beta fold hydrolase [Thalassobaculum fulvum]